MSYLNNTKEVLLHMGVMLRSGEYGKYYGNDFNSSNVLTPEQKQLNAKYILKALGNKGYTINAICGMLGNFENESGLNPGRWQHDNVGVGPAYGLVQWDHFTKYTNWCSGDPSTMDNNIARIIYEVEHPKVQWSTKVYPLTFYQFTRSKESPSYLARVFLYNYERPKVPNPEPREKSAEAWFKYLKENALYEPIEPTPEQPAPVPQPIVPAVRVQNTRKWLMSRSFRINIKISR